MPYRLPPYPREPAQPEDAGVPLGLQALDAMKARDAADVRSKEYGIAGERAVPSSEPLAPPLERPRFPAPDWREEHAMREAADTDAPEGVGSPTPRLDQVRAELDADRVVRP